MAWVTNLSSVLTKVKFQLDSLLSDVVEKVTTMDRVISTAADIFNASSNMRKYDH